MSKNTLLLLHGEDLLDSSPQNRTITNSGVTASSEKSKFGGKSLYFNGSAYLNVKDTAFNFGASDFTVDWWEYVVGNSATRWGLSINGGCGGICAGGGGDVNKIYIGTTGTSWGISEGGAAFSKTANTWVHWAFVRSGNTFYTFRNGKLFWSTTGSGSIYWNGSGLTIGSFLYDANHYFNGYIDEFRVSNIARWTSDFTPPTRPYLTDPMTPYDGHNTNIGNVAREIDTGDVLLGGVGREIESGLVLVNGVVREIDFVGTVPVSITGGGDSKGTYIHVIYDGVKYVPVTEIQVPIGGVIGCYLSTAGWAAARSGIYLNGVEKYRAGYGTTYTYYHTITGPTTIDIRGNADGGYGEVFITEE